MDFISDEHIEFYTDEQICYTLCINLSWIISTR